MVACGDRAVRKPSSGKVTLPGRKQAWRCAGFRDVLGLRDEQGPPTGARCSSR